MPKRVTVELKCDRCSTVWSKAYTPGEPIPETASVTISLRVPGGSEELTVTRGVSFDVLCSKCAETVTNYVNSVDRDPEARRKAGAKKKRACKGDDPPPKPATLPVVQPTVSAGTGRPT